MRNDKVHTYLCTMSNKKLFSFRFDPAFIEALRELAEKDGRSLTNYIEMIGKKAIEANKTKKEKQ
jgi:hypothetical protein